MYRQLVTTLGVLVAVMPFLGLPGSWKTPLYFILGGAIAGASYYSGVAKKKHAPGKPIVVRRSRKDFSEGQSAPSAPTQE
ncbi:MAG TPA: hypothetical protein VD967_02065 [Candidatus Paceibacterota bacterium]|nr:hypothetical protein [Candidatus Paceibacterota bacterium]